MSFIKASAIVGSAQPKAVAVEQPPAQDAAAESYEVLEEVPVARQPVSQVPALAAPPTGKLDGNAIRSMALRGLNRR
jgi:hypothetical protein